MGYYFHYFMREDTEHPMCITIFSGPYSPPSFTFPLSSSHIFSLSPAPNYCDMYGNDAAVLRITQENYEVIQADQVEHPFFLPDLCDAINYTLPFVFEECLFFFFVFVLFSFSLFFFSSYFFNSGRPLLQRFKIIN